MIDVLLLVAGVFDFWVSLKPSFGAAPLVVSVLLFAYAAVSFVYGSRAGRPLLAKSLLLAGIILGTVVYTTVDQMRLRQETAPHLHVHDHAMQIEETLVALLDGRNPYAVDYYGTNLELWWPDNPALTHVIALPTTFLKSVPLYLATTAAFGWYDERLAQLALLAAALGGLWCLFRQPELRLISVIAFVFNPLFAGFFVAGRGDIVFLSFFLLALVCLQRERWRAAFLFFALAVTSKHTAWFAAPFFLTYTLARGGLARPWRTLAPAAVLAVAIVLPFVLWDWQAFFADIYSYPAGTIPTSYPVKGYGFSMILHTMGYFPDVTAYFPSSLLQLALVPLLVWLVRDLYRRPSLGRLVLSYALLLWPFWFLSRFLNDNYLGVIVTLLTLGILLLHDEGDPQVTNAGKM